MTIKIFPKGSDEQLSPNFKAREFDCPCPRCTETRIDLDLVEILQKNRDHFGEPISPNAYRCPEHNAETPNAAKASKHTLGMAADFHVEGVPTIEVAAYNESIGVKGIGHYDTFVHVDTRPTKAFWYSHAQHPRTTFGGLQDPQEGEEETPTATVTVELPVLRKGSQGGSVGLLQMLLIGYGYAVGGTGADGIFGVATEHALTCFQEDTDLEADGVAGAETWRKLLGL